MEALKRALHGKGGMYPNASGHTVYFHDQTESGTPTTRAYVGLSVTEGLGKARKVSLTLQARVANAMTEESLTTLASQLKGKIERTASGVVEIKLDGTQPSATVEAGVRAAAEAAVRIWQERLKASESLAPASATSA